MNKTFFLTAFLFLINLVSGPAQGSEADDLIALIKTKASAVETFACDFRQERHLEIFSQPVIFKGRLLVDRPDRLRWEFTDPVPSVLILNKNKGIKCGPEGLEQEFSLESDPMMAILAGQLWSWLSGDYSRLRDLYDLTGQLSPPVLTITPKDRKPGMFEEIRIELYPELLHPTTIAIRESGGDRTLLFFKDYELNKPLEDSLFLGCGNTAGENDGS